MKARKIESMFITYAQLRKLSYQIPNDKFGIATYVLTPSRIKALLECPFNDKNDDDQYAIDLALVDGIVCGRNTYFTTKVMIGNEIIESASGSAYEVAYSFRHLALGSELFLHFAINSKYKTSIASGISDMALPLYKKMRFHILEFPRIMLLRHSRSVLNKYHLGLISVLVDFPLKLFNEYLIRKSNKLSKMYDIIRTETVPAWIDSLTLGDGHKYREYHNHEWLQWNLDNNFGGYSQNKQSFYIVYFNKIPLGFYMTKERFRTEAGGIKNVLIGSIVEWGSKNEASLSEADIILLSLKDFSKKIDIIESATANMETINKVKKLGFIRYGNAHIGFKDNTKRYNDASDINLWRIRYGYADVILT